MNIVITYIIYVLLLVIAKTLSNWHRLDISWLLLTPALKILMLRVRNDLTFS